MFGIVRGLAGGVVGFAGSVAGLRYLWHKRDQELRSRTYYKITNRDELHHGYQYHDGLNILNEPFNPSKCQGLHFTTLDHLHGYYTYGVNIRKVKIPSDAQCHGLGHGTEFMADKIILAEKYDLFDPQTIKELGLNVNRSYIQEAISFGSVDTLEWIDANVPCDWSDYSTLITTRNGKLDNLKWLDAHGLSPDIYILREAMRYSQSDIIKWLNDEKNIHQQVHNQPPWGYWIPGFFKPGM